MWSKPDALLLGVIVSELDDITIVSEFNFPYAQYFCPCGKLSKV